MGKARVIAVCRGKEKGKPKEDIGCGFFEVGVGLRDDAHAGTEKQVSLLAKEEVDRLAEKTGLSFPPGAFAENLLVAGLDPGQCLPGKYLKIGETLLQIQQIGKDPEILHAYHYRGYSLLAQCGIFARVLTSGRVKNGDEAEISGFSPPSASGLREEG